MKKCLIFLVLIVAISNLSAQTVFQKTFYNNYNHFVNGVISDFSGNFLIFGSTMDNASSWSIFLIKTNSSGQLIWSKRYAAGTYFSAESMVQTADSGFLITGAYLAANNDNYIHLTKIDASANWQWTKTYLESGYSSGLISKISKDPEGNYMLCGNYSNSISGYGFFIKVDSIGDTIFTRKYINPPIGMKDIIPTSDSSYFITGNYKIFDTLSNNYLNYIYTAKISKNGSLLYSRAFLDTSSYSVYPVKSIEISPGKYVTLSLNYYSYPSYTESSFLIQTSDSNNNGWQKLVYNNMPWGYLSLWDIEPLSGGGFITCGSASYYNGYGNSDSASSAIVEFDTAGNIVWYKSYGPAHNYYGSSFFDIEQINNLNYIAGGYIYYSGLSNPGNIFFLKLNKEVDSMCNEVAINPATINKQLVLGSAGNLSSGMNTSNLTLISTYNNAINDTDLCAIITFLENPVREKNITVYPNPALESITIYCQTKSNNPLLEIYNSNGALIRIERLTNTYQHVIRADDLANGLFLIKLIDGDHSYHSKFIKI